MKGKVLALSDYKPDLSLFADVYMCSYVYMYV